MAVVHEYGLMTGGILRFGPLGIEVALGSDVERDSIQAAGDRLLRALAELFAP